jgi:hypothetical protein
MSDLYEMKLHEEITKPSNNLDITIVRVPGGWIYCSVNTDPTTGYRYVITQTFVPFHNEFQGVCVK